MSTIIKLLRTATFLALGWLTAAHANDWLHTQLANGTAGLATEQQAVGETLFTLYLLANPPADPDAALQTLDGIVTELLARRIIATAQAGQATDTLLPQLLTAQNPEDGGFGDLPGYPATVEDTAFALQALTAAGQMNTQAAAQAVTFLKGHQTDGRWDDGAVYATALAAGALLPYRTLHELDSVLQTAAGYLLTQYENRDISIWEDFMTALVLLAAVPVVQDDSTFRPALDTLQAAQQADGSWAGDVYTTALALRALVPPADSDFGTLRGLVLDGAGGLPLAEVTVTLAGMYSVQTGADGGFHFERLPAGQYTLDVGGAVSVSTALARGEDVDLGILQLLEDNVGRTRIRGVITDIAGMPLAEAEIHVSDVADITYSNADGAYQITGLAPGSVSVWISKAGYLSVTQSVNVVEDQTLIFSPQLRSGNVTVEGVIIDGESDLPLNGVTVTVNGRSVTTDTDGSYRIEGLSDGLLMLEAALAGYDSVSAETDMPPASVLAFSPRLYPADTSPGGEIAAAVTGTVADRYSGQLLAGVTVSAGGQQTVTEADGSFRLEALPPEPLIVAFNLDNYRSESVNLTPTAFSITDLGEITLNPEGWNPPAAFRGTVIDGLNGRPLAGASITGLFGTTPVNLTANEDGTFEQSGLTDYEGELVFAAEGYRSATYVVSLVAGDNFGLAKILLFPEDQAALLADLTIKSLDDTNITQSPQSSEISGYLGVEFENIGSAPAGGAVTIIAFHDTGFDNVYDEEMDILLGSMEISHMPSYSESNWIDIPVEGKMPFRDAPITVWIDALQTEPERSENNNIAVTNSTCRQLQPLNKVIMTGRDGIGTPDPDFVYFELDDLTTPLIPLTIYGHGLWKRPQTGGSNWISPPAPYQTGVFVYQYTFTLENPMGVTLSGVWSSDNSSALYLNGELIANSTREDSFRFHLPFNASDDVLVTDTNVFTAFVNDWGVIGGFYLNAILTGDHEEFVNAPDLTAGHLRLIDNGLGQPYSVRARIGNAGLAPATATVSLDGTDSTATVTLAPGEYRDIDLAGVTGETVVVSVDNPEEVAECDETNNTIRAVLTTPVNTVLSTVAATDKPAYGPQESVTVSYSVTNDGHFPADAQVSVTILEITEDAETGPVEYPLAEVDNRLTALAGGETQAFTAGWPTGTTLSGEYTVRVIVSDSDGNPVAADDTVFTITAGTDSAVDLRTVTDKPAYHTTDTVMIENLLQNLSINTLTDEVQLAWSVTTAEGTVVAGDTLQSGQLAPQAQQSVLIPYALEAAAPGDYRVTVTAYSDGTPAAEDSAVFTVFNDLSISIAGETGVATAECKAGEAQYCTDTVFNQGSEDVSSLAVRHLLADLENGEGIAGFDVEESLDLAAGENAELDRPIDTGRLGSGEYACVLQAGWDDSWHTLSWAAFRVAGAPCGVYAVHNEREKDSQIIRVDPASGVITLLGPEYPDLNLEGLAFSPADSRLYAVAAQAESVLYTVNYINGGLTAVDTVRDAAGTPFEEVSGLAFRADGTLWGYARKGNKAMRGVLEIDPATAVATVRQQSMLNIDSLAWSGDTLWLFKNKELHRWDGGTIHKEHQVNALPGNIEGLDALPDGRLLISIHHGGHLNLYVVDAEAGRIDREAGFPAAGYDNLEAVAWPWHCETALLMAPAP